MSPGQTLLVALAGGLGGLARALLDGWITRPERTFPRGILAVNLLGALALGMLVGGHPAIGVMRVAGTGFLGGFTTFGSWMLDTVTLAARERRAAAAVNLAASLLLGVGAGLLGRAVV